MKTPYDTGKVKIGSNYFPDMRPALSRDDELIQSGLLGIKSSFKRNFMFGIYVTVLICGTIVLLKVNV